MPLIATIIFTILCLAPNWVHATPNGSSQLAQSVVSSPNLIESQVPDFDINSDLLYKILSAEMAISRGQPELALKNYIAVAEETQDPAVAQRATEIALSISTLESALKPAQIWANAAPSNLEAQITMVAIQIRLGAPEKTMTYLNRIMALDPVDADRHFVMLYQQLPQGENRQALLRAFEQLNKRNSNALATRIALADIHIAENKVEEGFVYAQKALEIDPKDPKAIILYAQALYQKNAMDEATEFLQQKLEVIPDNVPLNQYFAQFLLEQNKTQLAKQQMDKLSQFKGLEARQLLQMARLSMQAGWLDTAETFLQTVRQDPEQKFTAHYFLARLYEARQNPAEAIKWYERVLEGPFHVISFVRASDLLTELKDYDKAIKVLKYAEPKNYADLKRLSLAQVDVYTAAQAYTKAYELLSTYLQRDPEDMDYLYARALISAKRNQISMMEQDFKKMLEIDPHHIDALNALGFVLADKTDRYEEAKTYIERALKLSPNNPSILDSLGWVQFKMGQKEKAIQTLKKALDLFPDPEIAAHLGEVLWSLNKQEEATQVWQSALETYPDDESILQTMQRFVGDKVRQ